MKTGSYSIEVINSIIRHNLSAKFVGGMEDMRLRKCMVFGELMEGLAA